MKLKKILLLPVLFFLSSRSDAQVVEFVAPVIISPTSFFRVLDNKLFFTADDVPNGEKLWITDGTKNGTIVFKNITPARDRYSSEVAPIYKGKLYFTAANRDSPNINHLWISDGTDSGTILFKQTGASDFVTLNGKLFFLGDSGLWISDGTSNGTDLSCFIPVYGSGPIFAVLGNHIFFQGSIDGIHTALYSTDGTKDGTKLVKVINPIDADINGYISYNGKIYFTASDTLHGYQLWASDGTDTGTQMVKIINPVGDALDVNNFYTGITEYNNKLFFSAADGKNGYQLWESDGTSVGTKLVKVLNGSGNASPSQFATYHDKLYFNADGPRYSEFWTTDGSDSGTYIVKDSVIGPRFFKVFHDKLYFVASDGFNGDQLWISDGTMSGTKMLLPPVDTLRFGPLANTSSFVEYNNGLYFAADYGGYGTHAAGLWRVVDSTENVRLTNLASLIKFYPSFSHELLNFLIPQPTTFLFYNLMGVKCSQQTLETSGSIDISQFKEGIYFVRDIENTFFSKFIKE